MRLAKIFSAITMIGFVGCFSAMALQIGVANELVEQVTLYEAQLESKKIKASFDKVSYISSRWNNSAAYFALAAFLFLIIQRFINWKYIEKET